MSKSCLALWIARRVPRWLRYWVCIQCWAEATTGKYSHTVAPELRVDEMVRRIGGYD